MALGYTCMNSLYTQVFIRGVLRKRPQNRKEYILYYRHFPKYYFSVIDLLLKISKMLFTVIRVQTQAIIFMPLNCWCNFALLIICTYKHKNRSQWMPRWKCCPLTNLCSIRLTILRHWFLLACGTVYQVDPYCHSHLKLTKLNHTEQP